MYAARRHVTAAESPCLRPLAVCAGAHCFRAWLAARGAAHKPAGCRACRAARCWSCTRATSRAPTCRCAAALPPLLLATGTTRNTPPHHTCKQLPYPHRLNGAGRLRPLSAAPRVHHASPERCRVPPHNRAARRRGRRRCAWRRRTRGRRARTWRSAPRAAARTRRPRTWAAARWRSWRSAAPPRRPPGACPRSGAPEGERCRGLRTPARAAQARRRARGGHQASGVPGRAGLARR